MSDWQEFLKPGIDDSSDLNILLQNLAKYLEDLTGQKIDPVQLKPPSLDTPVDLGMKEVSLTDLSATSEQPISLFKKIWGGLWK